MAQNAFLVGYLIITTEICKTSKVYSLPVATRISFVQRQCINE